MILTITGKPGSGKSTAANFFKSKKANIVCADKIGHRIIKESSFRNKLKKIFPQLTSFSRGNIAKVVFANKTSLKKYDGLIHPILIDKIRKALKKDELNVIDAALFHELKLDQISDIVLLIKAKKSLIVKRSKKGFEARASLQKKITNADQIIYNNSEIKDLHAKLENVYNRLILSN